MTSRFLLAVLALTFLMACAAADNGSRRQLAKMGFSWAEGDLAAAAVAGNTEAVRLFMEGGMDPDAMSDGRPVWVMAALDGQAEVVLTFMEAGASITAGMARPMGAGSYYMLPARDVRRVLGFLHKIGHRAPELHRQIQVQTKHDMQRVMYAVENHLREQGNCPGPTEGEVDASMLRQVFDSKRVGYLPITDSWGSALLYWCDGKNYRVVSTGADGTRDRAPGNGGIAALALADRDLVIENGEWVEGP